MDFPDVSRPFQSEDGTEDRGFDAGVVDGIPGRKTRTALQGFQKSRGVVADGYPTKEMLALVTGQTAGTGSTN